MYNSKTLSDIRLEAGTDVLKEINLLEHEVSLECESMDVYTRLSQLYTAERNYNRSTEVITLAIDILNRDQFS
jgi:hypothetical protein